jgi:hypothetical protein
MLSQSLYQAGRSLAAVIADLCARDRSRAVRISNGPITTS